jgi:hypothetical protein
MMYTIDCVSTNLDLTFTLATGCGLIDRHFDRLLIIGDHDRPQGTELGVHLRVVHRPESMKLKRVDIPGSYSKSLKRWK